MLPDTTLAPGTIVIAVNSFLSPLDEGRAYAVKIDYGRTVWISSGDMDGLVYRRRLRLPTDTELNNLKGLSGPVTEYAAELGNFSL